MCVIPFIVKCSIYFIETDPIFVSISLRNTALYLYTWNELVSPSIAIYILVNLTTRRWILYASICLCSICWPLSLILWKFVMKAVDILLSLLSCLIQLLYSCKSIMLQILFGTFGRKYVFHTDFDKTHSFSKEEQWTAVIVLLAITRL